MDGRGCVVLPTRRTQCNDCQTRGGQTGNQNRSRRGRHARDARHLNLIATQSGPRLTILRGRRYSRGTAADSRFMPSERDPLELVPRFWFSSQSEVCLHRFRYRSGEMDSLPHTHDEYNIVFCLKPGLEYAVRGRREVLAPGDVLVINPGELHHGRYGSAELDARGLTIHIPVRALKAVLSKMRFPGDLDHNRVLFVDKVSDPSLVPLVEELIRVFFKQKTAYEMIVDSIILQILVHLFRNLLRPSLQPGIVS